MENSNIHRIKTISEFHRLRGLGSSKHPLISIIKYEDVESLSENNAVSWMYDFYSIALKSDINGKLKYGQQDYDFDDGVLFFMAPNQLLKIEVKENSSTKGTGFILLIHPDFLWNTSLAKNIKNYEYFEYSANEALHLSDKEQQVLKNILENIDQEFDLNIDSFSQNIVISQLETFFNYAERFYQRQFITRKIANHSVLAQLEIILNDYFNGHSLAEKGLPTVKYISEKLNISPNYLSGLLKQLTGQNTQQHLHEKLIEKAKEKLSTTNLSVSEIAYELGFEHSQSFSKLFKTKTNQTPLEFRAGFN